MRTYSEGKHNIQWKTLIICIAVPLAAGGLAALLTRQGTETFQWLTQPPLTPPAWLFPVAWTILYVMMGIASYLVAVSEKPNESALIAYGIQLFFNFTWSLIFFNIKNYLMAFIWLIMLWILIVITTVLFHRISKAAGWLMVPYLVWVTFAGYLNLGIYLLN